VLGNAEKLRAASGAPAGVVPLTRKTHQTIKRVTRDIEKDYHFNTAIAAMMELVNMISDFQPAAGEEWKHLKFALENTLLLLSPFCPHITEELWEAIGNPPGMELQPWPVWDEETASEEEIELVVQINGKVRAKMPAPRGLSDEELKQRALSEPKVKEFLTGKKIEQVFAVRGRLVNIVAS
jgi:leucyl-tRNA synthetase